jgi:L-malate glycosyltransferase
MRILHLFSDWKWTGPAEPTVSLCEALTAMGVDVTIAFRKAPPDFAERTVGKEVTRRAIKHYEGFRLNRYFSVKDWAFDLRAIKAYVHEQEIDVVHAHLSHDHYTAIASLSFSKARPIIVRSDHKRDGMPQGRFMAWAVNRTDGLASYSHRIMERDTRAFHFPHERTCVIPPGVKPYTGAVVNVKGDLGIRPEEMVIGVIGRLKPDRGYDVILKAFRIVRDRIDKAKLLVVGRSSQIEKSIKQPLKDLGLEKDVILAGYRVEDYFSVISAFDLFVMMRAGSDGSARALREVIAMGKPAIVSDSGILPELVQQGVTGYVVKPDARDLAEKMETLLNDEQKRRSFGDRGREMAIREWDYLGGAEKMKAFYEKLLQLGKRR